MTPPHSPEGRRLSESQQKYASDIQDALTNRNARIAFLEAELVRVDNATFRDIRSEAWVMGHQHEIEHLAKTGQFCPRGEACNPYFDER